MGGALFEALGVEAAKHIVFDRIADLDWIAADFTVFDIDLTGNGKVENHGDLFPAVGAHEQMFHRGVGYASPGSRAKAGERPLAPR